MTPRSRLAALGRTVAGAALGLGLIAGLLGGAPDIALAQAASAPVAAPAGQGPALWVIRDADSTIYLFGTVHMLRPETVWFSPRVQAAFDGADEVWFEISNPDDTAAIIPLVQRYGVSPDRRLSGLITTGELNQLQLAAQTLGSSALQMDVMRPWLVSLTLSTAPLQAAGYDPASGVELVLRARAVAANKPVHGLETLEQQVGFLAGFSEADQLAMLRATLEAFHDAPVELDRLVEAWARGDIQVIERMATEDLRESGPEVYRVMLTDRNIDWAGQIQTMLDGSGVIFIAVGAAHLAGPDSVQNQLAKRGVTVSAAPQ